MLYNKNILREIIESNFGQIIEQKVSDYVTNMDSFELEQIFAQLIDFAYVYDIENIEVEDYNIEEVEKDIRIEGKLSVTAGLEGFTHFDGENEFVSDQSIVINVDVSFWLINDKYCDFILKFV